MSPPSTEDFPQRLREAIGDRTQRSVAQAIGVSTSVFSQYLSGRTEPTLRVLVAIAHELSVSLDWLLGGPEWPFPARASTKKLDAAGLEEVLTLLQARLQVRNVSLPPRKQAAIASKMYRDYQEHGKPDEEAVDAYIDIAL